MVLLRALVEPADFSSVLFSKGMQYGISLLCTYIHTHTRIHIHTHIHGFFARAVFEGNQVRHICCLPTYTRTHIHIRTRTHTWYTSKLVRHLSACVLLSPSTVSKETYYSVKRDLLQCQKRPTPVSKETYSSMCSLIASLSMVLLCNVFS